LHYFFVSRHKPVKLKQYALQNIPVQSFCRTDCTCTKCILHTLSILQHVAARHTCHRQGVFVDVILTLSSGPLWSRCTNSQQRTRTRAHSKIPFETRKIFKARVFKTLTKRILSDTIRLWVVDFFLNNQQDALIIQILLCYKTLHVSGIFSAHHQDFSTVHSVLVSFMQVSDDRFQAGSGWNCVPS
jgi:hypothetical protein